MESLHSFITSRELEMALPTKVAHLKKYEEKLELQFCEEFTASVRFRWEGKKSIAEIILWESGHCDVDVAVTRAEMLSHRYKRCQTKEDFYTMLGEMIATISQNEKSV